MPAPTSRLGAVPATRRRMTGTSLAIGLIALWTYLPGFDVQLFVFGAAPGADDVSVTKRTGADASEHGRRAAVGAVAPALISGVLEQPARAEVAKTKFTGMKRINPIQFIAALGDPEANSGTGAETWGLWPVDPGPRGVELRDYERLKATGGVAPAQWKFDNSDWWLEEHGLIMEKPDTPLRPGRYVVTGAREVTTVLTIDPSGAWKLEDGKLFDVTHLPCRSARYTGESCTPEKAVRSEFPVKPGAAMPSVSGCNKQDYAVLFVIGVEA